MTLIILFLLASTLHPATPGVRNSLEQTRVHQAYNEGSFDEVLDLIGRFRNQNPEYSREDSLFIAKHLSVVYAANPSSVGQGKFWMNELLKLMPAADLVGMYVSTEIDRIFENVRKEFLSRQRSFGVDTADVALPGRPPRQTDAAHSNVLAAPAPVPAASAGEPSASAPGQGPRKQAYWILGGTAAVAAAVGVATYFVLADEEERAPVHEILIPRNPNGQ